MGSVTDISANQPHLVSEVICISCKHRWLSVRPTETLLKQLECPKCHEQGFVIETGQDLESKYQD